MAMEWTDMTGSALCNMRTETHASMKRNATAAALDELEFIESECYKDTAQQLEARRHWV